MRPSLWQVYENELRMEGWDNDSQVYRWKVRLKINRVKILKYDGFGKRALDLNRL